MLKNDKKPKLAISLVGISHLIHSERYPINRTYLNCFDNYTEELLNPLNKKFDISVHLTTYMSEKAADIIDKYSPTTCQFLQLKNSHQIITFLKAIEQIETVDADFIIFTRFDISFHKETLKNLNIQLSKFNFLCKEKGYWESHEFVNDCFYILPKKLLPHLSIASKQLYNNPPRPGLMDMHGLYSKLKDKVEINFMSEDHMLSSSNSVYTLKRL